jgi:hypothetical protein
VFTDRRTDTFFFIADFAFLDINKQLCPWKHMPFLKITNVVVNTLAPVLRTGLKTLLIDSSEYGVMSYKKIKNW